MEEQETRKSWLERVDQAIQELDIVPLLRAPVPFDWEGLATKYKEMFSLSSCEISSTKQTWLTQKELFDQVGENAQMTAVSLSPIKGPIFWIMTKEDVHTLTSLLLKESFSSDLLDEGFYRFALLNALDHLTEHHTFSSFSATLHETLQPEAPAYLCQEIMINANNHSFWGRLAISPSFQKGWNEHFEKEAPLYQKEIAKQVEVPLSIIAGKTPFHPLEWEMLQPGDCLICERMTYDPKHDRRMVMINVGNITLFHGKWKHDKIKLLDYAFYQEEKAMNEESPIEEASIEEETPIEVQEQKAEALTKVPLELTVEIARVKMTLDKLMSLQPGNVLHLSLSPNESVNLVVNNKKIGKGEIVLIGETLGVRILEIGQS